MIKPTKMNTNLNEKKKQKNKNKTNKQRTATTITTQITATESFQAERLSNIYSSTHIPYLLIFLHHQLTLLFQFNTESPA